MQKNVLSLVALFLAMLCRGEVEIASGHAFRVSEGDDAVIVFTSNGCLRVTERCTMDVLVVGGGGGGGSVRGGGGLILYGFV